MLRHSRVHAHAPYLSSRDWGRGSVSWSNFFVAPKLKGSVFFYYYSLSALSNQRVGVYTFLSRWLIEESPLIDPLRSSQFTLLLSFRSPSPRFTSYSTPVTSRRHSFIRCRTVLLSSNRIVFWHSQKLRVTPPTTTTTYAPTSDPL